MTPPHNGLGGVRDRGETLQCQKLPLVPSSQEAEEPERKRGKVSSTQQVNSAPTSPCKGWLAVPQEAKGAEHKARLCPSLAGVHLWGADGPGPLFLGRAPPIRA